MHLLIIGSGSSGSTSCSDVHTLMHSNNRTTVVLILAHLLVQHHLHSENMLLRMEEVRII